MKKGYTELLRYKLTIAKEDKFVTLNKWYASGHWSARANLKKYYKALFFEYFKSQQLLISEFRVCMKYNYNADVDNCITLVKIFVDNMRDFGIISNDNPKIFKSVNIEYDETLEKRTFFIQIFGIQKKD